jgi:predicted ATPase/DNA-binding winged helix-turn-helix (wHTH) protein
MQADPVTIGQRSSEGGIVFGSFRLEPDRRRLLSGSTAVKLGSRALDLLIQLASRPGEVISHRELTARAWAGAQVEESNLRFQIGQIRKALSEHCGDVEYVTSVPGRGYCFTPPRQADHPHVPRIDHASAHLPAALESIVGREADIASLSDALATSRLVTIVGPGGVGKTTLATAVARAVAGRLDEVHFVDLASLTDPQIVPNAVAAELRVPVQAADPVPALVQRLSDCSALLVLDNCEHVIETATLLVERLLAQVPGIRILATSREPLRAAEEMVSRLAPLATPPDDGDVADPLGFPAVQLFVRRARRQLGTFEVGPEDGALVANICRRLDGIPLAIELAVGRLHALGLAALAEVLAGDDVFLGQGRRTATARQRTIQATVAWSYDLLPAVEAAALRVLSVFNGSFTIEAAIAVLQALAPRRSELIGIVGSLVEKSLLVVEQPGDGPRYRLLETTRLFAGELLRELGEEASARLGHAAHYRDRLVDALQRRRIRPGEDGIAEEAGSLSNVRAALAWCFGASGNEALGIELAAAAAPLFIHLSLLTECDRWAERVEASPSHDGLAPWLRLELEAARSVSVRHTQAGSAKPLEVLQRALHLAEELGDLAYEIRLREAYFIFLFRTARFAEARTHVEEGNAAIWSSLGGLTTSDWMLAILDHSEGRHAEALRRCEIALRSYPRRRRPDVFRFGLDQRIFTLAVKARSSWMHGLPDQALQVVREAIEEAEELDHPVSLATALFWTGHVLIWAGDLAAAEASKDRLLAVINRHSIHNIASLAKGFVGALTALRGDSRTGASLLATALEEQRAVSYHVTRASVQIDLAAALIADGRPALALPHLDEIIDRARDGTEAVRLPEAWCLKAAALEGMPGGHEAAREAMLRSALSIARGQGALAWERRAGLDLARLLTGSGRGTAAAQSLADSARAFPSDANE